MKNKLVDHIARQAAKELNEISNAWENCQKKQPVDMSRTILTHIDRDNFNEIAVQIQKTYELLKLLFKD